jgi:hypothetical protein
MAKTPYRVIVGDGRRILGSRFSSRWLAFPGNTIGAPQYPGGVALVAKK